MSISLTISNPNEDTQRLFTLPIATETVFRNLWQVGISELKLTWIPLFETGIEVAEGDAGELIEELERLNSWAKTISPQKQDVLQMRERLERMIKEVPRIISEGNAVFIG